MKNLIILLTIFLFQIPVFAQQQEKIISTFESGNVENFSQYLDENVDLTILSTEGIYSKAQSKVLLKNFFATNTPSKFTLQHQGGGEMAKYVIGSLVANNKTYRVYFLFKKNNDKTIIQKLRIEND